MQLRPVGIGGVLAVLGDSICEKTGARVAALDAALKAAAPDGLIETIPAYATLLVRFDPFRADYNNLCSLLRRLEHQLGAAKASAGRIVEIPVCYGGAHGEDLTFVARHAGLSEEEVVRLHCGRDYRVYMLGFLPGFPYLGGLDERLHTPRLDAPRTKIPAGSVGIGGQQTGIYPMESPGGWQLIGRTPLPLDDASRIPYGAGDRIRFVPIAPDEYAKIELLCREGKPWRST